MGDGDVRMCVLSFSARSPTGDDAAYLRWHGQDHLPEQYRLAGIRHGARWVSTPACRVARLASEPRFDAVDHVVQYLVADPIDASLAAFFSLGQALHDAGRMPVRLPSVELGGYRLTERAASVSALVGAAVLPWRPALGVYLLIEEGTGPLDDLLGVDGVAGVWQYEGADDLHTRLARTGGLSLTVLYLDDEPVETAARLSEPLMARWASGAVRKCSSISQAPARKSSKRSMPMNKAMGKPIADQSE